VVGKALSGTAVSTIQAFLIVLLFPLLGLKLAISQILLVLCVSMLLSFCLSSLGILIAGFYESFESFSVIMNFIVMPMFFLSGAMYPVQRLPHVLGLLTRINPLTYGIDALKYMVLTSSTFTAHDFPLGLDIAVISAASLFFVIIAANVFERKK
jgi:ABC-2 type transport system permease protein